MKPATAAQHVLDTVQARFGPTFPGRVLLQPGAQIAWDECCDGQLAVRVISYLPHLPPAIQGRTAGPDPMCTVASWTLRLGVHLIQCVATVDDRGRAPTPDTLNGEAARILDDMVTIQAALLHDVDPKYRVRLISWNPVGPEGGCAGGEWTIDVDIT